jgi:hypothetical protein
MSAISINRRGLLAAGAAVAATAAVPAFPSDSTPIARAWARAETLRKQLQPHAPAIQAAFRSGGVSGWMRLKGEAYALGETRYGLLVEILNAAPSNAGDLDIQRRAARDEEMHNGPRDWARARVVLAERELRPAA